MVEDSAKDRKRGIQASSAFAKLGLPRLVFKRAPYFSKFRMARGESHLGARAQDVAEARRVGQGGCRQSDTPGPDAIAW